MPSAPSREVPKSSRQQTAVPRARNLLGGAVLAVLLLASLVWAPATVLAVFGRILVVVVGLLLLAWAWSWRRPLLRRRLTVLARSVRAAAAARVPVQAVYWLGSPAGCGPVLLRVVVATDAERDLLRGAEFLAEFDRLAGATELVPGHAGLVLTVDSQETVDRDCDGSWRVHDA